MDGIPTPYDIADLPASPFAPSILAWSILIVVALLAVAVIMIRRHRLPLNSAALREQALKTVRDARNSLSAHSVTLAAHALKRFVRAAFAVDLDSASQDELRSARERVSSTQAQELITLILELESKRFAPTQSLEEAESLLVKAESLL